MRSSAYKKFDKDLYKKYDELAKKATIEFLGGDAREYTENRYAQDIIYTGAEGPLFAECEVKRVWKGFEFPFDSVQLPARKRKFFARQTLFFVWNEDCTRAATFWSHMIKDLEPVEVPNRFISKRELFFQVPLDLVIFTDQYTTQEKEQHNERATTKPDVQALHLSVGG